MLMFTLAISCLTTSNSPWFMDLTVQVPMQYCFYIIGLYFHHQSHPHLGVAFASTLISSFFLESFLHWSPIVYGYWLTWGVHLSVSYLLPFHTVHGVLKARIVKWFAIPSPVDHILSDLYTMICLYTIILGGPTRAHSLIELDKTVVHVISLISFLRLWFSFCWWIRIRSLWKLPDGRYWGGNYF